MQLKFSGESLGDLYGLTGVLLPNTPPYATDGHLIARLHQPGGAVFEYQKFDGKIGDSDIHGDLKYVAGKPRPTLNGAVNSRQLRLADLAPLIGADSNAAKAGRGEKSRQPADKVLPVAQFDTQSWRKMDADEVCRRAHRTRQRFTAERSGHAPEAEQWRVASGSAALRHGGRQPERRGAPRRRQKPMRGQVDMHARKLQLKQLLPNVAAMKRSLGQMNGDARLTGSGNSVAELLATSNGDLRLLINNGVISRSLMEILGLNVGNYLVAQLFGDDVVGINCAAADVGIRSGVAAPRLFVFDTENAVINITGNTNLATERLDLSIDPESKGMRVLTLRSPLYVKGTFKHPDAGVKAGPLIARGAAAVALGAVLTPAAALLALVSPSEGGEENQCGQILREMKGKK